MRKIYKLFLVVFPCVHYAFGQDSLKTTVLREVVTTATRYERAVIETPRSVSVITGDAIRDQSFNSVGELLANYAGIYLTGPNQTPGSTQSLFMRGASSNQVAILVDGVRINDPSSPNSALDLNELSLTNVDRVEILRGSHSTLYGGAAVGGVVNIITRRASSPGFHGNASINAGTFGRSTYSLAENVGLNYSLKNGLYFNGSLFNQNVSGLNASLDTLSDQSMFHTSDDDGFDKTDAYGKIGFQNSLWNASVSYKRIDQRSDIDDGAYNDDDNAFVDFKRDFVDYEAGYKLAKNWELTGHGSWSSSKRMIQNDSSIIDETGTYDATFSNGLYKGTINTNEIILTYKTGKFTAIAGAGRYDEKMNFNTYFYSRSIFGEFISNINYDTLDTSSSTNYVFGQGDFSLGNFNVTFGTRWSNHSAFGHYWTFEASPSLYLNRTLLFASISTGFNPPSLYQLFDPSKSFNAATTRGNRLLDPETSTSIELGLKREFSDGSYLTLSAFRTVTNDAIEYVYLWNSETPIGELTFADNRGDTYLNVASQLVNGIELEGQVIMGKFLFHGNISWIDGKIKARPSDIDASVTGGNHVQLFNYGTFITAQFKTDKLARRPNIAAFAEATFMPRTNISLSASYRYAGPRFDAGYDETLGPYGALTHFEVRRYNLVDLAANWKLNSAWSIGLKLENIFDESYREILGFQTRGRSAYLKLNFRW